MAGEPRDLQREIREALQPGAVLAETLQGLSRSEAVERVTAAGFRAVVVPPDAQAMTADLRLDRVRVYVDAEGLVTRASAG